MEDPSQIAATKIAVGLWGGDNIQYLQLPRMNVLYSDRLPSDVIPRSVMLVTLERYDYVFYALGKHLCGIYLKLVIYQQICRRWSRYRIPNRR